MTNIGQVNIIGCGVSGMTTAISLLNAGYEVTIFTEKLPSNTTSAKAAAIWFPYEVRPQKEANRWSKYSYEKFQEFLEEENSGISIVDLIVILEKESDAWWKDALPKGAIHIANRDEFPDPFDLAYRLNVPLIETQDYLDFLLDKIKVAGGNINIEKLSNIEDLFNEDQILINCAGLGAADLFADSEVYPIQGQIVKIQNIPGIPCITAEIEFDENGEKLAYVVPRNDCIILGGTAVKGASSLVPDEDETQAIIQRCKSITPSLGDVVIEEVLVGLRPGRSEIRLERQGNVIHNYGHGGGGFTVSWGCADDVLQLVNSISGL